MTSKKTDTNGLRLVATTMSSLALLSLVSTSTYAQGQSAGGEAQQPAPAPVFGPLQPKSGSERVRLTVSGHVNRGILVTEDGDATDVFFVDNDNSSTRIRLLGDVKVNDGFAVGSNIEVQFESNSTADVSQDNERNVGDNNFTERKLEVFANSQTVGKLSLGQGDTASNGTSEVDLSGTAVIGYSGVQDFAGGIQFQEDGVLSGITIGNTFNNLDGLGRDDRARYDTPSMGGVTLSTSASPDDRYDAALRIGGTGNSGKLSAAIAYADADENFQQIAGSTSMLLSDALPGVSVTLGAGVRDFDQAGRDDATFYYGKLGYQFAASSLGKTALAVDYFFGENFLLDGDEATAVGVLAVQNVNIIGTEVYAGLRNYQLDSDAGDFDDIYGLLVGARVKF